MSDQSFYSERDTSSITSEESPEIIHNGGRLGGVHHDEAVENTFGEILCTCSKQFRNLFILAPVNLDLDTLVIQAGLEEAWRSKKGQSKLAVAVHLIMIGHQFDRRLETSGYWVPIDSRVLVRLLGPKYSASVMRTLAGLGVIEINGTYSAGRFSKSYRLARQYASSPARLVEFHDVIISRKLRKEDDVRTSDAIRGNSPRAAVWQSLQAVSVTPEALSKAADSSSLTPRQHASRVLAIRNFACNLLWLRADETSGRVFHNVTQCPRDLRPLLTIDGEPTAEVDLSAAQFFFALSLYHADHPERTHFASVVTGEDFYAWLFNQLPFVSRKRWGGELAAWADRSSDHRDRFKRHVIQHVLYDTVKEKPRTVFTALGEAFPWLGAELAMLRATKAGASALGVQLQRYEAELMIGRVVPRIHSELAGCKPVTIHDGILCQRRFAGDVRRIVEEESRAVFGVAARVRVK